ncbi:MAG: squalene synthase HpnC, partial [Planctomycetia bacterium]|nr:squalene synthase HpnC [Planctomycetia bacterium]
MSRFPSNDRLTSSLLNFVQLATTPCSLAEAEHYCRRLAQTHYENFTVVSRLFPRALHQHFCNVYAYCRWADDLADEPIAGTQPLALLDWWESHLNAAYAGEATHPVFVALRETIREFELPKQPFADLLVAFRRDQVQTRYETLADLLTYCEKSANPVGRIVLMLGRCATHLNLQRSDSICTGLQLANFWQDVRRDYERGRIYLPQEICRRYGWDETHFATGKCDPQFRDLLQPLVAQADAMLAAGRPLIRQVSADLRLPVQLFIGGGQAILAAIR